MDEAAAAAPAARADARETGRPGDEEVSECCRYAWLSALTLAENVLLDDVYDRVLLRSPQDAVRECVFALRLLREAGRAPCPCDI